MTSGGKGINWEDDLKPYIERRAQQALEELKRTALDRISFERATRCSFEGNLWKRWGDALNIFEIAMIVALEAGAMFNDEQRPTAAKDNDHRFDVLCRLHARACGLTSEIYTLLKSGHATGAMARWRALHEVAVTALLIRQHGKELTERYLEHEIVESHRAMQDYEKCYERLGYDRFDAKKASRLKVQYTDLIQKYGKPFSKPYGWAAEIISKDRLGFADLEKAAGLDHMRPYYRMSSHGIHANPKGIMFNVGLLKHDDLMLAGTTNAGLADPGDCTLISLYQSTVAFLTLKPSEDILIMLYILQSLMKEAGQLFSDIHKRQVAEEAEGSDN